MRRLYMITFDFETRSECDLEECGGRIYSEHPTTEVICVAWFDHETRHSGMWRPDPRHRRLSEATMFAGWPAMRFGVPLIAHNGVSFDRHIWRKLGWPEPPEWIDTAELARRAGFPLSSLDWLAQHLLGVPKDHEGNKLTRSLSRVPKPTKKRPCPTLPEITPEIQARVELYGMSDVGQQVALFEGTGDGVWPAPLTPPDAYRGVAWAGLHEWVDAGWENDVSRIDRIVNDRGVAFDGRLATELLELDAWLGEQAREAAQVDARLVRSGPQLKARLAELGVQVANVQKATISDLIKAHGEDSEIGLLAGARAASSTICAGKLRAGLAGLSADGRERDLHKYLGAHTWRWSGVRLQVQNLPKGDRLPALLAEIQAHEKGWAPPGDLVDRLTRECIEALLCGDAAGLTARHVPTLLRACLMAPEDAALAIVDYSQVEARALAWASGDLPALELFRTKGTDPYKRLAARIYNRPESEIGKESPERDLAKRAELGCGYGMGVEIFYATTQDPKMGKVVDWQACPVTPDEVVAAYRAAHPAIVQFWADLNYAALEAAQGGRVQVGAFEFASVPGADGQPDVWCMLPSGRPIVYHRMHVRARSDGKRGRELCYLGQKNGQALWIKTYGGALTENVIQAFCRDLLAHAMVRCEAEGLRPVFHVHDELVCEVPRAEAADALALQEWIMCDNPPWAAGMPTRCEGFLAARYRK